MTDRSRTSSTLLTMFSAASRTRSCDSMAYTLTPPSPAPAASARGQGSGWSRWGVNALGRDLDGALTKRGGMFPDWRRRQMDWAGDALYVGLAVLFFGLTWAFVKLCERV